MADDGIRAQLSAAMAGHSVDDEQRFQGWIRALPWFEEFKKKYGEEPDLDTQDYDYRAAWRAGVAPEKYEHDGGAYHWPSGVGAGADAQMFKSETHPTMWMQKFLEATGRDPHEMGITTPEAAQQFLSGAP